ncbi:hypothetical protein DICPUDRAFT_147384 [Dictyostelium purpureum]|uniref:Uncharacterized protein n=1 Tax=Dictyostelium purpureum TaxID=5786 RepID=F0Z8D3_DICPU|nr:uncharacterized protein DICPUDRAFT_147384 [Dictyostelium purpureum]EGC39793.1 hypothetical protein DICPUDRAFT_147384 [Dictyostelium purpureum]|eukprot:XP_003283660.1 hypothetical protein DICPUDRAFT_147384 [Dictyostelium purpureum]
MKKYNIVLFKDIPKVLLDKLNSRFNVEQFKVVDKNNLELFNNKVMKSDAIIGANWPISTALVEKSPSLKAISALTVGYDAYPLEILNKRGIALMNTPNVLSDSLADMAIGLMLSSARRIVTSNERVKNGEWVHGVGDSVTSNWFGEEVHHKKVGIVGCGRIGEIVAKRCFGFDMDISYYTRTRHPSVEENYNAKHASLEQIIKESDFIINLLPLSKETEHLFTYEQFKQMKRTAHFINVGRGKTVKEDDLERVLQEKLVAGIALDVFEKEPLPKQSPLMNHTSCILSPHAGNATKETNYLIAELAVNNLINALDGSSFDNCVNFKDIKDKSPLINNKNKGA